jgi:hypothetical protein
MTAATVPIVTPIIKVDDVAFPRFSAPDLEVMEAFLLTFGMQPAARTESLLVMRGTDGGPPVHVTHRGDPGFLGLAFRGTRDDLAVLAAATGAPVETLDLPGGGEVVSLTDPDGRRVDVVAGCDVGPPVAVRSHPVLNTGDARPRVGALQRVAAGPSQVKRFGHAALKTGALGPAAEWYCRTLGLLVSDEVHLGGPEQPVGCFLRCDRGDRPADHHSVLLVETGEAKLGHCAWEVADFDDLMVGHDHLAAAAHLHYWGIGRHVLGGQVFDYWKDPLGFTVEHWTDSDLLTAATPAGSHHLMDALSQWGPPPPPDLDF